MHRTRIPLPFFWPLSCIFSHHMTGSSTPSQSSHCRSSPYSWRLQPGKKRHVINCMQWSNSIDMHGRLKKRRHTSFLRLRAHLRRSSRVPSFGWERSTRKPDCANSTLLTDKYMVILRVRVRTFYFSTMNTNNACLLTCYPISKRSQQGYQHHRESLWMSCLIDKVESNMLGSLVLFVFWGKYVWDMCVYNTSGN